MYLLSVFYDVSPSLARTPFSNKKGNTDHATGGQCVPKHLFPLNTQRCCGGAVEIKLMPQKKPEQPASGGPESQEILMFFGFIFLLSLLTVSSGLLDTLLVVAIRPFSLLINSQT